MASADDRVGKGAAWLDQDSPGWERAIDLGALEIMSCTDCILGQVYAHLTYLEPLDDAGIPTTTGYHIGRERMRVQNLDPYDHGFTASGHQNRADVEAAWARAIAHRLSNAIV